MFTAYPGGFSQTGAIQVPPTGEPILRCAGEIAEFIDGAKDIADALDQLLAELGQRDLPCAAFQEGTAERILHFADLHRQCRL